MTPAQYEMARRVQNLSTGTDTSPERRFLPKRLFSSVSTNLSSIRHLLIDLDGVLYRGDSALPGAESFIQWLGAHDIRFRLVTNNATLTPQQYVQKLAAMGIHVAPSDVFTSALATARYFQEQQQSDKRAFVIGETGIVQALTDIGMTVTDQNPDWVVVGLDRHLTYDKLAAAALAIEAGASFLGTNPDTSFPSEAGLVPGAGALQAALVATTGRVPIVIGKPQPLMLELAMSDLGSTAETTAMLGDRLDTDIKAGNDLHMATILVLTGVSHRADIDSTGIRPDLVVPNLPTLIDTWAAALAGQRL